MTTAEIYAASDGEATKALYARLEKLGPAGLIAVNLFRAQKCSARAKVYRRRYKGEAYDRKNWSMQNLCKALIENWHIGIKFGWKEDPSQEYHKWVLYVDLPTGQVSFHAAAPGAGPDYDGEWDGIRDVAADRIIAWIDQLLGVEAAVPAAVEPGILPGGKPVTQVPTAPLTQPTLL